MLDHLYPETIEESGRYLRMALQFIARHKLPYNPITYALWYEYATGRNSQLIDDIDALKKENVDITFEMVLRLFRKHLADRQMLLAEKKTTEFQAILSEMICHLGDSRLRLEDQGNSLESHAIKLGQTTSLENVSNISRDIVSEAKAMLLSGQELTYQINSTALEINTLKKELEGIKNEAKTDMLTGLLNRRGLDEAMVEILGHSMDNDQPFSMILADIDHFKRVNDTHGHLIGDNILKMLSRLLKEHIKGQDIAARFGGEEFILILPQTPMEGAYILAEQIRMSLRKMKWVTKDSGRSIGSITISLGVARYRPGETMESLIERTDKALYLAKNTGRNKTMTELDFDSSGVQD